MLKKLIKYDLISINKTMLIYFVITFIVCILTRIMSYFNDSFIGNTVYLILRGCAISCYASCLINCVIRIWVRFKTSIYKDESYLTHTLPISKSLLFNSKILSSVLSLLISLLVILVCFIIVFLNRSMIELLSNMIKDSNVLFILISLIITIILETTYMMLSGITGIIIGNKSNSNKTLKSVFIGIALYFAIQLIILAIIYGIGLLNTDISSLFDNSNIALNVSAIRLLVIIVNILYTAFIAGLYFVNKRVFIKGVNVE